MFSPLTRVVMNMRRFLTDLCLLAALPLTGHAQETADSTAAEHVITADSTDLMELHRQDSATIAKLNEKIARYEKRIARRNRIWLSMIPSFYRLQYAGSVGLINAGAGWHYGRQHQWETDFMFGFVPRYAKDDAFATFTLRQTYVPWTRSIYRFKDTDRGRGIGISWQPLSCGLFLNSVLQSDYWTKEPERYPDRDYYRFSSKIRFHLFLGQRYTVYIPRERRYIIKSVSAVWELSSCDLYIVSKFVNGTLPLKDILSLSFGLKFGI